MKKILKNNTKTKSYLDSLPKIYAVVLWAGYGTMCLPYAGKCDKDGVPYVYDYNDHNGTADQYELKILTHTTTGCIYAWTIGEASATMLAEAMNRWKRDTNKRMEE